MGQAPTPWLIAPDRDREDVYILVPLPYDTVREVLGQIEAVGRGDDAMSQLEPGASIVRGREAYVARTTPTIVLNPETMILERVSPVDVERHIEAEDHEPGAAWYGDPTDSNGQRSGAIYTWPTCRPTLARAALLGAPAPAVRAAFQSYAEIDEWAAFRTLIEGIRVAGENGTTAVRDVTGHLEMEDLERFLESPMTQLRQQAITHLGALRRKVARPVMPRRPGEAR